MYDKTMLCLNQITLDSHEMKSTPMQIEIH